MKRVLVRTMSSPFLSGVGAVSDKQAMISPSTAGTGTIALGLVMGFLSPVTALGWAGLAALVGLGTGIHIGSWLETQQGTVSGTGGLTAEQRGTYVAYATAGVLVAGAIYAGLKGMFFLGGVLAVAAPFAGHILLKNAEKKGPETNEKVPVAALNDDEELHFTNAKLVQDLGGGTVKAKLFADLDVSQQFPCSTVLGQFNVAKNLWTVTEVLEDGGCFMVVARKGQTFALASV